jgi:hypothetical protein
MHFRITAVACLFLFANSSPGYTQDAYPAGVESLVSSLNAITTAEDKEIVLFRSSARLNDIRGKLVRAVIESKGKGVFPGINKVDSLDLLCSFRKDYIGLSANQNYLTSIATELKKTATGDKIDSLTAAILVLFKNYAVEVSDPAKLGPEQEKALANCKKDFTVYADSYYNFRFQDADVGIEEIFSPFSSLIKLIIDIVTPVAEAGAKLIDDEQRRDAIREFLKKPGRVAQITTSATFVNSRLVSAINSRRYQRLGQFADNVAVLATSSFDLAKEPSCEAAFDAAGKLILITDPAIPPANDPTKRPSQNFIKCMKVLSDVYGDKIAATLKSADDYDQLADAPADVQGKKLKAITDNLAAIANGTTPNLTLKDLWTKAVEIAGFAQTVITASSKENRDKVKAQIDALVKAL